MGRQDCLKGKARSTCLETLTLKRQLFLKSFGAAAAGLILEACGGGGGGGDSSGPPGTQSLMEVVRGDPRLSVLAAALEKSGVAATASDGSATLTLFAPTNDAFDQLAARIGMGNGTGLVNTMTPLQLVNIMNFNLLPQRVSSSRMATLSSGSGLDRLFTLYDFNGEGAEMIFARNGQTLVLWDGIGRDTITLAQTDIAATNGVLHVANDVPVPRRVLTVGQIIRASFDTFAEFSNSMSQSLFEQLNLTGSKFTAFAPTNDAVNGALSDAAMRNHILPRELDGNDFPGPQPMTPLAGRLLTLNGRVSLTIAAGGGAPSVTAEIQDVDFFASNGVVHAIARVLRTS
jgi:Fasciclin domain